jgi:stearoyl-CoA desaturase (Delta-9 desaturase)
VAIFIFFVLHWELSVFFQSFFHHRYGAHKQFTMSKGWERTFHLTAYLIQGSSYLVPRAYAVLHRMHHAYSDTERDPHSPQNFRDVIRMMWGTKKRYHALVYHEEIPEPRFAGGYPEWRLIDRLGESWIGRVAWGSLYLLFYLKFATAWWMFALVPIHLVMGPLHGAIVNWCGHKYGYRNFDSDDVSKNTLPFDFVTAGELLQNNHHRHAMRANFAVRLFEIDTTWQVIRVLHALRIIKLKTVPGPKTLRRPAREPALLVSPVPLEADGR